MLPMISIGPAAVPVRPMVMLIAFFVCLSWTEKRLAAFGLNKELAFNTGYLFGGVLIVAGRLWYAATHWQAYEANPAGLVSTSIATIAFSEGAVIAAAATLAYLAIKRVSPGAVADAATPGILALFALASLGALASGDAHGAPTTLPWAITLWDAQRHPSQVYELLVGLVTVCIVLRLPPLRPGSLFLIGGAFYASARVFVEAFRGDSLLIGDGFRAMQIAWLALALAALLALRSSPSSPAPGLPDSPNVVPP